MNKKCKIPESIVDIIISYVDFSDEPCNHMEKFGSPYNITIYVQNRNTLTGGRPIKSYSYPYYVYDDSYNHYNSLINFPEPLNKDQNYQINMMPFIFGNHDTLPDDCKRYIPIIDLCAKFCTSELGKVCYLTIDESFVKKGYTQRRSGLHTESAGRNLNTGGMLSDNGTTHWGGGIDGGIFMASNIDKSTLVYNAYINDNLIGFNGDVEYLRKTLDRYPNKYYKQLIPANRLLWITDRTPHESLPVVEDCYRQYFRLVTSNLTFWHSQHSTPNPLCPLPPEVKVLDFNKFTDAKRPGFGP